jgi:hypothetical protein
MKKLLTSVLAILIVFSCIIVTAQEVEKPQMYRVHQDHVKFSMVPEYEGIIKELKGLLEKHNIEGTGWLVLNSTNATYAYVSPINTMADINNPIFKKLSEKAGKDVVSDLFKRMDNCYDIETDYIIYQDNELSYTPDGFNQTPDGQDYRNNHLLYYTPGKRAIIKEKMKAVKDLFEKKGSKVHYRVYRSGFGTPAEYYMVAIAAKDAEEYARKGAENDALIGEEGQKIMGDLFGNLLKHEEIRGDIRRDLMYVYKKSM